MIKKRKSNSWWSIISFPIFKIRCSMTVWILMLLSFILFGAIGISLFLCSKNTYEFLKDFQYSVLIFNNILLLLFILLTIIKIFGREFEDGTYLLLISKPYSRFALFFLKLISLWILIFIFLGIIIIFALIIGYIGYLFKNNLEYLQVYQNLLLKLFIYSLKLSFFSSSGIILIITFLNSQIVLLIVVIFCSLFLVGGLPYSLIMSLADKNEFEFKYGVVQNYPIPVIKSTINFKKNLKKKLIKYNDLTNKIWDFYNDWNINDLKKVFENNDYKDITENSELRKKRLKFYESLSLTKKKVGDIKIKNISKWNKTTNYNFDGKINTINNIINSNFFYEIDMNLHFVTDFFFKSPKELNLKNPIHKDVFDFINNINEIIKTWDSYINMNIYNGTSLFYFNLDESYYSLSSKNSKIKTENWKLSSKKGKTFNPTNIFNEEWQKTNLFSLQSEYDNGIEFQNDIFNFFNAEDTEQNNYDIKTLFVIREIELNILKKIIDYKYFELLPFKINKQWQNYNDLMFTYNIISKINIIEHWNQIWTNSLSYIPFWFEPLQRSNINFDIQNNYLMSYQNFRIILGEDQKINFNQPPILNINFLLYFYLGISCCFLIISYIILSRKNIT